MGACPRCGQRRQRRRASVTVRRRGWSRRLSGHRRGVRSGTRPGSIELRVMGACPMCCQRRRGTRPSSIELRVMGACPMCGQRRQRRRAPVTVRRRGWSRRLSGHRRGVRSGTRPGSLEPRARGVRAESSGCGGERLRQRGHGGAARRGGQDLMLADALLALALALLVLALVLDLRVPSSTLLTVGAAERGLEALGDAVPSRARLVPIWALRVVDHIRDAAGRVQHLEAVVAGLKREVLELRDSLGPRVADAIEPGSWRHRRPTCRAGATP